MKERLVALNETVTEDLSLELTFSVTTLMRWMLTEQMSQSLQQQAGMHGEATVEEMRRMFAETSPWLLAVTALVSMLHTLFDILAFKNDITCDPALPSPPFPNRRPSTALSPPVPHVPCRRVLPVTILRDAASGRTTSR